MTSPAPRNRFGPSTSSDLRRPADADPATEAENDAILAELVKSVRVVKKSVTNINKEVKSHLTLLDRLLAGTTNANNKLQGTVRKLQEATGMSSTSHVWLLFAVAFFVFVFIVLLLKRGGS